MFVVKSLVLSYNFHMIGVITTKQILLSLFARQFGPSETIRTFFSPGRVNLIGEHIDYNGGFVFPTALSIGTYGAIALRQDRSIRLYSENFPEIGIVTISLDDLKYKPEHHWANYVKGIIGELIESGHPISTGFDIALYGDLPNSSGLSSSASVELLIGVMMNDLFNLGISRTDLALLGKKVENEYIGVNCGIMDQFVIANGLKDHALLLDCDSLEYKKVPLVLKDYSIVICNSKIKRGLSGSKYNERRAECQAGLEIFKQYLAIENLCDMSQAQFDQYASLIKADNVQRRCRHAVTENQRVVRAVEQLKADNLIAFGKAITESHESLKTDYEVSIPELDTLVELALKNGSIGSRMTGAGFGGCTVNLVKTADIGRFSQNVIKGYEKIHHLTAEIYVALPSDGTKELL
jgi:galactokinase